MKRRYPGPQPFSYDDRELFFGRAREVEYLSTVIVNNKTTILHAKSGFGKSSLLNAGLIPDLLKNYDCQIIRVRFHNYDPEHFSDPCTTLFNALKIEQATKADYLHRILDSAPPSAWRYFKQIQAQAPVSVETEEDQVLLIPERTYILIFDQFEELFTYPAEHVQNVGKQLQDLLMNRIPDDYQQILKESYKDKELLEYYDNEFKVLDKDFPIKIVFSVRSDRFNLLTHLTDYIPNLLSNTHKLSRMTVEQVKMAITEPAKVNNGFISPAFHFDPALVDKIISFLTSNPKRKDNKKIDISEMQIICQRIEEIVVDYYRRWEDVNDPLLTEDIVLQSPMIKDKEHPYSEIIKNYYHQTIESINDEVEQLIARFFIERKLIDSYTKNRISLDDAFIQQIGIKPETLQALIDKRIVRVEINSVSGRSYEISHDSLVTPITNAAHELGELDVRLRSYFKKAFKRAKDQQENKVLKHAVFSLLEEDNSAEKRKMFKDSGLIEKLLTTELIIWKNPGGKADKSSKNLMVKEAFLDIIHQAKVHGIEEQNREKIKKYSIGVGILAVIIAGLLVARNQTIKTANHNFAMFYLGFKLKQVESKEDALRLGQYIYDNGYVDPKDSLVKGKFLDIFHTPEIQAKFGIFSYVLKTASTPEESCDISADGKFACINNASKDSIGSGNIEVFDLSLFTGGKNAIPIERFFPASYAYFIGNSHLLLVAGGQQNGSKIGPYSSIHFFTIYNCDTHEKTPVKLDNDVFLYPSSSMKRVGGEKSGYQAKLLPSGSLSIPVSKIASNGFYGALTIRKNNGIYRSFKSPKDEPPLVSKDGNTIIVSENLHPPYDAKVLDTAGKILGTFSYYRLIGFSEINHVYYTDASSTLYIRDSSGIKLWGALPDDVYQIYTDDYRVIATNGESIYSCLRGTVNSTYSGQLVAVNFPDETFVFRGVSKNKSVSTEDTLFKRSFDGALVWSFIVKDGIQKISYNANANTVLLLTNSNKLLLLDALFRITASFQLTVSDYFGFSSDGRFFYYVLDKSFAVFKNDDHLIDLLDFDEAYKWIHRTSSIPGLTDQKRKNMYELRFDW